MRLNTIVTLGASAAFGLMAVFLARGWINAAVENEFRDIKPPAAQPTMAALNTVPVLIADMDLAFGDILSPEAVRIVNYPQDAVPTGTFSDFETVFEGLGDRVVLSPLNYNEPILEHKISGPNGKASLSARIRPGYRAVAVRVDEVTGVAGFVVPGDVVDVIYTREPEMTATGRLVNPGAASAYISDIILQNITVLGVDQNQLETTSSANIAQTVTLEVTNEDGQALNLAMEYGTLSLSLRGTGEVQPTLARQLKLSDLGPRKARNHKPKKRVKRAVKPKPVNVAQITVIRGRLDDEETVEHLSVRREKTTEKMATSETSGLLSNLAGG